jgi:predicted ATPase
MINKITIKHFKKFKDASYEVNPGVSLFVGPNNGGKTTALQAIALWSFLIQEWNEKKGKASGSKAKKKTGAQVTRNAFYAVPVQDMKLLWFDTETQTAKQKKISIQIIAEGTNRVGETWEYGIELDYGGQELSFCRPLNPETDIPEDAKNVFHLPPLSGVQTQEAVVLPGKQKHIIGEGRPGEVLRNLLLQIQEDPTKWGDLCGQIKDVFGVQIENIIFNPSSDANILVYYRHERWSGKQRLEISNGGSGFLQFLLLAAFLYAHDHSILLIDEPDSHMHVRLQQGMYDWLQKIAMENYNQILIATHSEVIINSTDTDNIQTVFGKTPKRVQGDKAQIVTALKGEITAVDILNAQEKKFVLFAEGISDLSLLKIWAENLKHDIRNELNDVFFKSTDNDQYDNARDKFKLLQIVEPDLKGFFIRDGDVKKTEPQHKFPGLEVRYWPRQEIENYLIIPNAIERFIRKETPGELYSENENYMKNLTEKAKEYLKENLPPKVYNDSIRNDIGKKGSDFLEDYFREIEIKINKAEYWKIAEEMHEDEIHPDIRKMLDDLLAAMSKGD